MMSSLPIQRDSAADGAARDAPSHVASSGRLWIFLAVLGAEQAVWMLLSRPVAYGVALGPTLIVFTTAFLYFARERLRTVAVRPGRAPLSLVAAHITLLFALVAGWLVWSHAPRSERANAFALLMWLACSTLATLTLLAAFFPKDAAHDKRHSLRTPWFHAVVLGVAILPFEHLLWSVWNGPNSPLALWLRGATFTSTAYALRLLYPRVVCEPAQMLLGTPKFQAVVEGHCSGIEGLLLTLLVTVSWLFYRRKELRMKRAVWLVPAAMMASWLLNMARLTALIAIGDAGHAGVAVHGFHSEAGWLAFNAVTFGFLLAADRWAWLRRDSSQTAGRAEPAAVNIAAVYLMPFLLVLAASMVGRAMSSGFDWLYPLRLIVAMAAFWWFRAEYRRMDWRFGWLGPLAGAGVFAMWLLLARWQHLGPASQLGADLAQLAAWQRMMWIASRAIAAVVTVPLAEELAFRGYVARRFMSADVQTVPFARLSVVAMLASSLLFGAMHGRMWIAGTIAGLVFAAVAKARGRLGEAVAAHATANLLIAVWVLVSGDFGMW